MNPLESRILEACLSLWDDEEASRQTRRLTYREAGLSSARLRRQIRDLVAAWESGDYDAARLIASGDADICALLGHNRIPLPDEL